MVLRCVALAQVSVSAPGEIPLAAVVATLLRKESSASRERDVLRRVLAGEPARRSTPSPSADRHPN